MTSKKLKVVFCGTPDIAVPTLEVLYNHPYVDLVKVVTPCAKPAGRGQQICNHPVANYATDAGIPVLQTENINKELLNSFISSTTSANSTASSVDTPENVPDLFIVFAFCQFLSNEILNYPLLGCYNIHASLLPYYRGAAPIQHAIKNGEKVTGITIQKMVKKMDAGDIVHADEVKIYADDNSANLYTRLKFQAAVSINTFIEKIWSAKFKSVPLTFHPQNEAAATYAPCLKREDGYISKDFLSTHTAQEIKNQTLAYDPWPGSYCQVSVQNESKRLKIISVEIPDLQALPPSKRKTPPGVLGHEGGMLVLGCSDRPIRLKKVQLEGKKAYSDTQLLNGIRGELFLI